VTSTFHSTCPEETAALAKRLAAEIKTKRGQVVAFFGDLGSGKTTFIRELACALTGIQPEEVCSPTFQYLNMYKGQATSKSQVCLFHFDLYRLQNKDDFLAMGFDEFFQEEAITCIEWAERIQEILPEDAIRIFMKHTGNDLRTIEIQGCAL
jgi:tRNA threonylcarbamoyladenosine biosynthesis protein TsaE